MKDTLTVLFKWNNLTCSKMEPQTIKNKNKGYGTASGKMVIKVDLQIYSFHPKILYFSFSYVPFLFEPVLVKHSILKLKRVWYDKSPRYRTQDLSDPQILPQFVNI